LSVILSISNWVLNSTFDCSEDPWRALIERLACAKAYSDGGGDGGEQFYLPHSQHTGGILVWPYRQGIEVRGIAHG
jgi:hypothetical protein